MDAAGQRVIVGVTGASGAIYALRWLKAGLELGLEISENETLRTEISCKYDRSRIEAMLGASGFRLDRWFTDRDQLFALALAQKS